MRRFRFFHRSLVFLLWLLCVPAALALASCDDGRVQSACRAPSTSQVMGGSPYVIAKVGRLPDAPFQARITPGC